MNVVSQFQSVNQVVMATGGDLHQTDKAQVGAIGVVLHSHIQWGAADRVFHIYVHAGGEPMKFQIPPSYISPPHQKCWNGIHERMSKLKVKEGKSPCPTIPIPKHTYLQVDGKLLHILQLLFELFQLL